MDKVGMIHSVGCPSFGVGQRCRDLANPGLRRLVSAQVHCPLHPSIAFRVSEALCRPRIPRPVRCSASAVPARAQGRQTYKPPSFAVLIQDAATALTAAVADGFNRLEVEFPVLPEDQDGYRGSSDEYIDTNIQLAIAAAKLVYAQEGKRVHIIVPDAIEYNRAFKLFKQSLELSEGITLGHLQERSKGLFGGLSGLFGAPAAPQPDDPAELGARADMYIAVNASTVELPDIERYTTEVAGEKAMVLWNLGVDTLRADLGLLGFPSKEMQYRFLAAFKPVFYIRPRNYSKSVAVAPFIINYSGCLFREYPGPWQVMLRQDSGVYACVAEDQQRYTLFQVKKEMQSAMGLDTEEEGSAMAFLRQGYKTSTWWEDAVDLDKSNNWRT